MRSHVLDANNVAGRKSDRKWPGFGTAEGFGYWVMGSGFWVLVSGSRFASIWSDSLGLDVRALKLRGYVAAEIGDWLVHYERAVKYLWVIGYGKIYI